MKANRGRIDRLISIQAKSGLIFHRQQRLIAERRKKNPPDQIGRQSPAAAMTEKNAIVVVFRRGTGAEHFDVDRFERSLMMLTRGLPAAKCPVDALPFPSWPSLRPSFEMPAIVIISGASPFG